jgi:3-phosphoshikimate 1-carboxyvinyltransferase
MEGLDPESAQGDKVYKTVFEKLSQKNQVIDLSNCPDLGPICMALAYKNGALFTGTDRLKAKESDRCSSMSEELAKFGIKSEEGSNSFKVYPSEIHRPCEALNGHNDHRIVMALSVLCTITGGIIDGAQAVSKSLPDYFKMLKRLGIKVNLYETA